MRQWLTVLMVVAGTGLAGCATNAGTQSQEAREAPVYRTGSIIPKRERDASDVQTVDPQAVRDALGGKPPSVRPGT
jgi:outer membrane lipoprotein SlyB